MNIRLGQKIKELRKTRNISQEVLAQYLGVSFQAVSKWETETAMPDVALIPAIASFFGVSTDELFDYNRLETEKKIMDICWKAAEYRSTDAKKSEEILREGLKMYPGNDIILNNLLYTMRAPERSEEVISLCKTLIESTKEDDVKYDAARILAETYHDTNQQNLVLPTLEIIPEIYFSKLELVAKLTDGKTAFDAAEMHAHICISDLIDMLMVMRKHDMDHAGNYECLIRSLLNDEVSDWLKSSGMKEWLNQTHHMIEQNQWLTAYERGE
ncbi:MAG: helix-turn-helix transcriptional regulator [Erysipelotrichaceae bacterium]|nr:helix-turn-helix transcriptional regulator [Erysipelotrichaceae bacterium]